MEAAEYEVMARVEERHWWYRALRDVLTRLLATLDPPLPPAPRVLDAGCGTGANLKLIAERLEPSYLGGFDRSARAVELTRAALPRADVYAGDLCRPRLRVEALDLVISMDVVCIPGIEAAMPGLRELVDRLSPGGRLILNLPAYQWLYSRHDVAVHTRERYTRTRVRELLTGLGLEVERLTYRIFLLFPLVVAVRAGRLRRPGGPAAGVRSDLHHLPGPTLNRALLAATRLENRLIAAGWRLPWGSSVLAVGRKP
jgi:SAM-dependent methyltransferase